MGVALSLEEVLLAGLGEIGYGAENLTLGVATKRVDCSTRIRTRPCERDIIDVS